MTRSKKNRNAPAIVLLVAAVLLLQNLAPPGYMAGSLANGWPVVLCPDGLPAGFLGHDHDHLPSASTEHDLSLDGHCPLGSVFEASIIGSSAVPPGVRFPAERLVFRRYEPLLLTIAHLRRPSRAPPAFV